MSVSPSTKLREAGSSKPIRKRIGRRLSAVHILTAIVVILAFVLNLLVLQDRDSVTLVAIADRSLTTGSVFTADDVRLVPLPSDFEGLPALISDEELAEMEGWVLDRAVQEGTPIEASTLVPPGSGSGLRAMSIPIGMEHAAGGTLSPGDRVDVISVIDGSATWVATDVEVIGVAEDRPGSIGVATEYHVILAVAAEQALSLAEALEAGSIEVIRSTGAAAVGTAGDGS